MPTKNEIREFVKVVLADEANISPNQVVETGKLADFPLTLDSVAMGFIAIKLRKFVKTHNPVKTVKVSEVRKPNLTVQDLINLIDKKIN